jgi:hypothetical protein
MSLDSKIEEYEEKLVNNLKNDKRVRNAIATAKIKDINTKKRRTYVLYFGVAILIIVICLLLAYFTQSEPDLTPSGTVEYMSPTTSIRGTTNSSGKQISPGDAVVESSKSF